MKNLVLNDVHCWSIAYEENNMMQVQDCLRIEFLDNSYMEIFKDINRFRFELFAIPCQRIGRFYMNTDHPLYRNIARIFEVNKGVDRREVIMSPDFQFTLRIFEDEI